MGRLLSLLAVVGLLCGGAMISCKKDEGGEKKPAAEEKKPEEKKPEDKKPG